MPPINMNTCHHAYPRVLVVTFLVLWMLGETLQRQDVHAHQDNLGLAASDLAKSMLSLFIWFVTGQLQGKLSSTVIRAVTFRDSSEGLPICNDIPGSYESHSRETISPRHPPPTTITLTFGSVRSILFILVVSLAYSLRTDISLKAREFVDPFALYLAFPAAVLGILVIQRVTCWRSFPSAFWHACGIQFAGFFITRDALVGSVPPDGNLLIAFALSNAIWISLVDLVYGLHRSSPIHFINTLIFAQSSIVYLLLFLLHPAHDVSGSFYIHLASALQVLPLIQAAKDIVAMLIIEQYGALGQGILISLASTLLIVVDTWKYTEAPYPAFLGCLIAIVGFGTFIHHQRRLTEQQDDAVISARRLFAAVAMSLAGLGYIAFVVFQNSEGNSPGVLFMPGQFSGQSSRPKCRVPESSPLIHSQTIADYGYFKNVLLVVFFSHARYDANLDFHKEVYADYFPNIIYIGPASREDKGFGHSYDVVVDSFQSEEDLSDPLFYRMAGRMAHHMLYTALREYDCYDGYLWVPFDTLLNIPRLQQFDQNLFWYHSPWGQPVPNPALGNITELELDRSRHAPPAMISPDPSLNLTETWRGWGPDWCDPHVGVSVCMRAFNKVPREMQDHLSERLGGQTRLIGGSADTLYIPGRHRKTFMAVLALFLETNCFLEIATPTTVHLVVPPGETIQFVEHWWIYQPPFNASFVRQKWAEGYEVDTFHTFHWGERGGDGIWRGDHRHVADVRHLLRESAVRQGLSDTFPVNADSNSSDP